MVDFTAVLPAMTLGGVALLIPAVRLLTKSDKATGIASVAGIVASMLLVFNWFYNGSKMAVFEGVLRIDAFSALFMLVFLFVALYVVIASLRFVDREKHTGEYYALVMLATAGMMVVAMSMDLITLFVGIEITSLSSYSLVAFRKKDKLGAEAATKYFIIGGLSSALSLFGISLVYGATGQVNFHAVAAVVAGLHGMDPVLILAIVMVMAGFGFKVAIVPFHMWAPDVYEGAPTTITAMLASGSKKMGFIALFKVFIIGLVAIRADWSMMVGIIAIATMTLGNLIAISQTSIKRMLAYSSIAQAGYILIVLPIAVVGDPTIAQYGLAGGIFHMLTHAFMKGGAFIIVAGLATAALGEKISDYKGLYRRAPLMAFAMTIMLFSLAGIPPLAGFMSKFVLFSGAINASTLTGEEWLLWLAVAAIINSAISLYYYARVVKYMYLDDGPRDKLKIAPAFGIAVAICFVAVILIGIFPDMFIQACQEAAKAFFTP
jgi:proton-translocating NADH-quinone oxidoreductase chain N